MNEIQVHPLGESDWEVFKAVRLRALKESPEAFVATYDEEVGYDQAYWEARLRRSYRLVATLAGETIGVVSVGRSTEEEPKTAELFGLWVAPSHRGSGIATKLVSAASQAAQKAGKRHLIYWVGTENGRAVAFASGFGFRPTAERRPMRVAHEEDEEEIAMVLPIDA